jgi:hypothetical protein
MAGWRECMKGSFKKVILAASPVLDVLAAPLVLAGALFLKLVRSYGIGRLSLCRRIFWAVGVMPVTDHYYDPFFKKDRLRYSLREDRDLPGVDMNTRRQLDLISCFHYNDELSEISRQPCAALEYYYDNPAFLSGDAEILYSIVRHFKPRKLIEVGSGFSSLMALKALDANLQEDGSYSGELICIEPYEYSWLEDLGVTVHREPVQSMENDLFRSLSENDILFIDSSHIIKPQSDVLFLYLKVLPALEPGVLVHIHDIFTPRDYLDEWVFEDVRFWNEQYLLESFMTLNSRFEVIAALNYLMRHHRDELLAVCPVLREQSSHREPGSFWIRRIS